MGKLKNTALAALTTGVLALGPKAAFAQTEQSNPNPSKPTTEETAKNLGINFQKSSTDVESNSPRISGNTADFLTEENLYKKGGFGLTVVKPDDFGPNPGSPTLETVVVPSSGNESGKKGGEGTNLEPDQAPEQGEGTNLEPDQAPEQGEGTNIEPDQVPEQGEGTNLETDQVPEQGEGIDIEPDKGGTKTLIGGLKNKMGILKGKPTFQVHGMIRVGTEFIPDFFDITSPDCALLVVGDITNNETGLGLTLVRVDNFSKDPSHPFSQVTVINPHRGKDFGKAHVGIECKYNFIDKAPEANGFTPDIVLSYSDNGWKVELVCTHKFQAGKDANAVRLGFEKEINERWKVTLQALYDSGFDKKFAGNLVVDLGVIQGLHVQLGCARKDGTQPWLGLAYQR